MTCPACRRAVPDAAERCPACGTQLDHDARTVLSGSADDGPVGSASAADDSPTSLGPIDDAGVTSLGPLDDGAATSLALPVEPDHTRLASSPEEGATSLSAPPDEGATSLASPEPDAPPAPAAGMGPLTVGQQFSPRYIIVKLLGVGGMGAVYQAWDGELSVMVALKVILPEATKDPAAAREIERRFKQELLLARQVTHKNVVRIHDLGEIDGIKYITMPYIEGEDLASVLKREGRLPVTKALALAREIAAGLCAAHEAGVVHRDLKPANIMIEGDHAVIMDFGIARTAGPPAASGGPTGDAALKTLAGDDATHAAATVAGAVIGTVQYMAPEQARGQSVDQRADVYAFGLMLYDMLAGQARATRAESAIAELQQRLLEAPPPIRTLVPDVPDAFERIIARCVEPDADLRFQTTAVLVEAFDRLDEQGKLLPVRRSVSLPLVVTVVLLLLSLSGFIWWSTRPPVVHDPVSVVVADFANTTGDEALDGVMEPTLQLALEDADFISAYDRLGIRRVLGVRPPDVLDQEAARQIALQQGVGVVLAGSVATDSRGYLLSVRAIRAVTGEEILATEQRASTRDQVLETVADLATAVRRALGDDPPASEQRFARETLSARNLEAVGDYRDAMVALSESRFADALTSFESAVARDPEFGLSYAGMAIASRNLDRQQDAEQFAQQAVSHVDSMTERERYRTRGLYYMVTGDHQKCVEEYGLLIERWAADAAARNNRALCSTYLRQWQPALEEMRQVVTILPGRALYKENLILYLSYAGDFQAGEEEALDMADPGVFGLLGLAFAQLGQDRLDDARQTYQRIGAIDELGASYRASGLGDLAMFEGRYTDAARIFSEGAAIDAASGDAFRAAAKLAQLAQVRLLQGQSAEAIAAAEDALAASDATKIQFTAARVFAEAGASERAQQIADALAREFQTEPRTYGKIIEGLIALEDGRTFDAVTRLTEANELLDTWIGHFDLGRAYLAAEQYIRADSEFDIVIGRRGEVLALFLDEEPTWGLLPPAYFYQGQVREGLGSSGAAGSYDAYLRYRGNSTDDPLVADARQRAGR